MLGLSCCSGSSPVAVPGLLIVLASLVAEHGLSGKWASVIKSRGLGTRGSQGLPGSRAQARLLWRLGLVATQHVGFSRIRDGTHVSCISRWILYHWAIRETWGWWGGLKISMGEDQGHHEAWVKIWGDARQQKEALRWNWGEVKTLCQVM